MIITQAKQTADSNWVKLIFDDGSTSQVSIEDGVNRQHTSLYNEFLVNGSVLEPEFTQAEIDAKLETQRIADIKAEAHARILTLFGATEANYLTKELNALMRWNMLKNLTALTVDEQTEYATLESAANALHTIRNTAKTAITNAVLLADVVW